MKNVMSFSIRFVTLHYAVRKWASGLDDDDDDGETQKKKKEKERWPSAANF